MRITLFLAFALLLWSCAAAPENRKGMAGTTPARGFNPLTVSVWGNNWASDEELQQMAANECTRLYGLSNLNLALFLHSTPSRRTMTFVCIK